MYKRLKVASEEADHDLAQQYYHFLVQKDSDDAAEKPGSIEDQE